MAEGRPRGGRTEPREIVELQELKRTHPELATAVDMQIELIGVQRRVQARVPLPWIQADPEWLRSQRAQGRPVVRFGDIPIEWSDFRLTLRQTADILRRFDALEEADHRAILQLGRSSTLETLVAQWYETSSGLHGRDARPRLPPDAPAALEQVLVLALRPFLARCADALAPRADPAAWPYGYCPLCGWEPDFGAITESGDRRLICGRCLGQWPREGGSCPFCGNDDRSGMRSFAMGDGRYRVEACDVCRRYLKVHDARHAPRPILVAVDSIATLPLDAAAMQRGYVA